VIVDHQTRRKTALFKRGGSVQQTTVFGQKHSSAKDLTFDKDAGETETRQWPRNDRRPSRVFKQKRTFRNDRIEQ